MAYWPAVPFGYALFPVVKTVPPIPSISLAVSSSPEGPHSPISPAPTRTGSVAAVGSMLGELVVARVGVGAMATPPTPVAAAGTAGADGEPAVARPRPLTTASRPARIARVAMKLTISRPAWRAMGRRSVIARGYRRTREVVSRPPFPAHRSRGWFG